MSIENTPSEQPSVGEIEKPRIRLLVASANIIDAIGGTHGQEDKPFQEARWTADSISRKFELQAETKRTIMNKYKKTYTLKVFGQLSYEEKAWYQFNTETEGIIQYDVNGKPMPLEGSNDEATLHLISYLDTAEPYLSSEHATDFLDLISHIAVERGAIRRRRKLLGLQATFGREDEAIVSLVRKVQKEEPLLDEARVRLALMQAQDNGQE